MNNCYCIVVKHFILHPWQRMNLRKHFVTLKMFYIVLWKEKHLMYLICFIRNSKTIYYERQSRLWLGVNCKEILTRPNWLNYQSTTIATGIIHLYSPFHKLRFYCFLWYQPLHTTWKNAQGGHCWVILHDVNYDCKCIYKIGFWLVTCVG
jgi:hypothetical protein